MTNSNDLDEDINMEEKNIELTNENWNKNEQSEFDYFFGKPIEVENTEELSEPIPQDQIEDLIYDEKNPKEIKLDEPYTKEELEQLSDVKIEDRKEIQQNVITEEQPNSSLEQSNKEQQSISDDSEINEFIRILKEREPDEIENQPEVEKKQEIEDDEIFEYLKALKENAIELKIDKKIKRKVEKDKKQGRIKRFFINIKNHFNEKKVSELRDELKQQEEKGGRTK